MTKYTGSRNNGALEVEVSATACDINDVIKTSLPFLTQVTTTTALQLRCWAVKLLSLNVVDACLRKQRGLVREQKRWTNRQTIPLYIDRLSISLC